ncbi:MAG: hypothetical protein ACETWR_10760 [Anaerolineae bacterium]
MDIIGAAVSRSDPHDHAAPLARIEAAGHFADRLMYPLYGLTDRRLPLWKGAHHKRDKVRRTSESASHLYKTIGGIHADRQIIDWPPPVQGEV